MNTYIAPPKPPNRRLNLSRKRHAVNDNLPGTVEHRKRVQGMLDALWENLATGSQHSPNWREEVTESTRVSLMDQAEERSVQWQSLKKSEERAGHTAR
jgi:hypothetical protein